MTKYAATLPNKTTVTRNSSKPLAFATAIKDEGGWSVARWHDTLESAEKFYTSPKIAALPSSAAKILDVVEAPAEEPAAKPKRTRKAKAADDAGVVVEMKPRRTRKPKADDAAEKAPRVPRTFNPAEHDTFTCQGACGQEYTIEKFPTTKGGLRGVECRKCRDARRTTA